MNGKDTLRGNNLVADVDDLCRIIAVCAKNGILEARVGELQLIFGKKDQSFQNPFASVQTKPNEQQIQKISEEAKEQDRISRIEYDLEELKLSDPLGYERLLGVGELGDGGEAP